METRLDTRGSVLIVDRSAESREVLRAVFEPRGLRVLEASAAAEGLALARRHSPDVIVLDPDLGCTPANEVAQAFERQIAQQSSRLVVLGSAQLRLDSSHIRAVTRVPLQGEYLAKPYHYAPLIRKIESLLANSRTSSAKAA